MDGRGLRRDEQPVGDLGVGEPAGDEHSRRNFLALVFCLMVGTAALPHILIRYYTVKDQASARKSTIVGIAAIGSFFAGCVATLVIAWFAPPLADLVIAAYGRCQIRRSALTTEHLADGDRSGRAVRFYVHG